MTKLFEVSIFYDSALRVWNLNNFIPFFAVPPDSSADLGNDALYQIHNYEDTNWKFGP